jgi:hypothetical protein
MKDNLIHSWLFLLQSIQAIIISISEQRALLFLHQRLLLQ